MGEWSSVCVCVCVCIMKMGQKDVVKWKLSRHYHLWLQTFAESQQQLEVNT